MYTTSLRLGSVVYISQDLFSSQSNPGGDILPLPWIFERYVPHPEFFAYLKTFLFSMMSPSTSRTEACKCCRPHRLQPTRSAYPLMCWDSKDIPGTGWSMGNNPSGLLRKGCPVVISRCNSQHSDSAQTMLLTAIASAMRQHWPGAYPAFWGQQQAMSILNILVPELVEISGQGISTRTTSVWFLYPRSYWHFPTCG